MYLVVWLIVNSKKQTSVYYNKLNQFEECIPVEVIFNNGVPNELEDDTEIKNNAVTYRDKFPIFGQFELICKHTLVSISEVEYNSQLDLSILYNPQVVEFLGVGYYYVQ